MNSYTSGSSLNLTVNILKTLVNKKTILHGVTYFRRNPNFITQVSLKIIFQYSAKICFSRTHNRVVIISQIKMSNSFIKRGLNNIIPFSKLFTKRKFCHNLKEICSNNKPLFPDLLYLIHLSF